MNKRIYLSSPTMHGEEMAFVKEAFETNWVAPLGPNVDAFEEELAAYVGVGHAAALSSGTAAIHLALRMLDLEAGDHVFVSSLTFSASVNPILYEQATPVLIDCEPDTWNISPAALARAFEKYPKPKAVIVVHLYGTSAKLDEIMAICAAHEVPLIEDAAESLGATYRGRMTGSMGRMGVFSFNGNKIITSSGGGMLVSDDKDMIAQARFLATQARDKARHYQHSQIGYNYRMSNIVAGIGRGQLLHLNEHIALKQQIYRRYQDAFADIQALSLNPMNAFATSNNWLSCLLIAPEAAIAPERIMDALEAENIECRPIWKPMHMQPVFAAHDYFPHGEGEAGDVSADIFARGLCLPSDIKNSEEDMERIITIVRNSVGHV